MFLMNSMIYCQYERGCYSWPVCSGSNCRARELMQERLPVVSLGPSSKTWPRCAPQFLHTTSVRLMKKDLSSCSSMFAMFTGSSKLGQPDPDSNLVSEENSGLPQATQLYIPAS